MVTSIQSTCLFYQPTMAWRIASVSLILTVVFAIANVEADLTSTQKMQLLNTHNAVRRSVQPPATDIKTMKWSRELENTAQNYANQCIWGHNSNRQTSPFSSVGENLYTSTGDIQDYGSVVRSWYDEAKYYHYDSNTCDNSKVCGHYTQVVWANSDSLGCGVTRCANLRDLPSFKNALIVVCNYGPSGNFIGEKPYRTTRRRSLDSGELLQEADSFVDDENQTFEI
ncbi:hypothetical protein EMCRGX_G026010 [Ephydatia muelleri]